MKHLLEQLRQRLAELDEEREKVANQILSTERQLSIETGLRGNKLLGRPARGMAPVSPVDKIGLFLELFRCRDSVYPKRWENSKTGNHGYSPACSNEWRRGVCEKPRIKCGSCKHQAFERLDENAAASHLKGLATIGSYSIKENDTTIFLVCDFDGTGWRDDISAYRMAAESLGIEVAVERSRSGQGGHAWIFFEENVPAQIARLLGTVVLTRAQELRCQIDLKTFDRLFPNQDSLPSGGFGNLIALPLQKSPRASENTVFLDASFNVISDQWQYLSQVRRLNASEIRLILLPFQSQNFVSSNFDDDLTLTLDEKLLAEGVPSTGEKLLAGETVEVNLGSVIRISVAAFSSKVVMALKRTASFANPEFYKLQRMRRATYPEPRFIFSGELRENELSLPRGCLDSVSKVLQDIGAKILIRDERLSQKKFVSVFKGELKPEQKAAVNAILKDDTGILEAPPGAGKTVMGCALIAERKVATLILVHRQPLLEQWRDRIQEFLGLDKKEIGVLGGSSKRATGKIDLAMLQTLARMENLGEIAENYSQIIIDEAHHIPAASFEGVMKMLPARYVIGLTATPYRKDGLQKIIFQQCGPIRHTIKSTDSGLLKKKVVVRETDFRWSASTAGVQEYHVLVQELVTNVTRNALIVSDAINALNGGRFPVLVSDRKDHLERLEQDLKARFEGDLTVVRMVGDAGKKERREHLAKIGSCLSAKTSVIILATGSLIGEGFDLPELDTLLLTTPLSFKGRMIQYVGRLHRVADGKSDSLVYDYVDSRVAVTLGMYRKRVRAYRSMGYQIDEPTGLFSSSNIPEKGVQL